jgi:hypothetical protein
LPVPVSSASGYSSKLVNIAEAVTSGIEIALDATPVKSGKFRWDVTLNWAHNDSKIISLAPGIDGFYTGTQATFGMAKLYQVKGAQWGQLQGRAIQRDGAGNPVIGATGAYVSTDASHNFGSVLPTFTGGLQNYFTYQNFRLNFNIDYQYGGKYFSLSDMWGTFSGLTERTATLNDKGNPQRQAVGDGGGVHVTGVDENGNKVDTYVDANTYHHQWYNSQIAENSVYDLTFVKLRELSLSYAVPVSKLGTLSRVFKTASVSLIGRNLWLIYTPNMNYDPSIMSNTVGENGQLAGTRSYGVQIKLGL